MHRNKNKMKYVFFRTAITIAVSAGLVLPNTVALAIDLGSMQESLGSLKGIESAVNFDNEVLLGLNERLKVIEGANLEGLETKIQSQIGDLSVLQQKLEAAQKGAESWNYDGFKALAKNEESDSQALITEAQSIMQQVESGSLKEGKITFQGTTFNFGSDIFRQYEGFNLLPEKCRQTLTALHGSYLTKANEQFEQYRTKIRSSFLGRRDELIRVAEQFKSDFTAATERSKIDFEAAAGDPELIRAAKNEYTAKVKELRDTRQADIDAARKEAVEARELARGVREGVKKQAQAATTDAMKQLTASCDMKDFVKGNFYDYSQLLGGGNTTSILSGLGSIRGISDVRTSVSGMIGVTDRAQLEQCRKLGNQARQMYQTDLKGEVEAYRKTFRDSTKAFYAKYQRAAKSAQSEGAALQKQYQSKLASVGANSTPEQLSMFSEQFYAEAQAVMGKYQADIDAAQKDIDRLKQQAEVAHQQAVQKIETLRDSELGQGLMECAAKAGIGTKDFDSKFDQFKSKDFDNFGR